VRSWQVAGALIEGPAGLLLVQNRRRDGSLDWTPPGGVIDPGEDVVEGLTREVLEETGLVVTEWEGPAYIVEAHAPDLAWDLRVEVHRAVSYEGVLHVDDPDGIVVDARFFDDVQCLECVAASHHWVREPLSEWLVERVSASSAYRYRVEGVALTSLRVHRL
jgi:8-oxo-dGTP diphosphatase